jgi:hypothetical protein
MTDLTRNLNFFNFYFILFNQLSTTPGDKEGIDVWFVMLESAKLNEDQV